MIRPIKNYARISTKFKQGTPPHKGIDYAAPEGQPIVSPVSGVVTQSYPSTVAGNTVEIKEDGNGRLHRLLHLKSRFPVVGNRVKEGQLVGISGGKVGAAYSGTASTGPHLHWDVRKAGSAWNDLSAYFDPEIALKAAQKPVAKVVYYIVRRGDFLGKIAAKFGTTWQKLYAKPANRKVIGSDPNKVKPGEKLDVSK